MTSIKQRPNGAWRARYRDDMRREHSRHFKTKREAQRWLDEITTSMVTGMYVDPRAGVITLSQYYEGWSTRQIWAASTKVSMDLAMKQCTFRDLELRRLTRSHVEAWVKEMVMRGLAPGTIRTRVNNVRSVIRAAVRDRRIPDDPSAGVTLPRVRRADVAMRVPTPDEVGTIMGAAEWWFRPFIAVCAFAGLRLGEGAGLQAKDIDFLRRTIHVRRQVQRVGARRISITPPKYGSERDVFVPDELLQLLSEQVKTASELGGAGWLFIGQHGDPPHQNTVGYWWRNTLEAAGLEDIRLHDLRHFFASGLIAAGCDVVTVQRALGHSRATTTLNTYSHLWPTAQDRTRAASAGLVADVLRGTTLGGSAETPPQ